MELVKELREAVWVKIDKGEPPPEIAHGDVDGLYVYGTTVDGNKTHVYYRKSWIDGR